MVDGATNVTDLDSTKNNRNVIQSFVENILMTAKPELSGEYINEDAYKEHDRHAANSVEWLVRLSSEFIKGSEFTRYKKYHRILAEGNFVLSV